MVKKETKLPDWGHKSCGILVKAVLVIACHCCRMEAKPFSSLTLQ